MLVCFDATVLCGAIRKPTGLNFRLLRLAADRAGLEGFTSDVAGMEFIRNATEGLSGVRYSIEEITEFLDVFEPLFDFENVAKSPVGRSLVEKSHLHDKPVGEVVYELTGRTREELLGDVDKQTRVTVGGLDHGDLHLVAVAVERGADVICSSNRKHLPAGPLVANLEVMEPHQLASELGIV